MPASLGNTSCLVATKSMGNGLNQRFPRREKCAGICVGPARFAEDAQVVEHRPVDILVVLRVPQTVVVNDRAVAAIQLVAAPIYSAVIGEDTPAEVVIGGGGADVQHTVAGQREGSGQRSRSPADDTTDDQIGRAHV